MIKWLVGMKISTIKNIHMVLKLFILFILLNIQVIAQVSSNPLHKLCNPQHRDMIHNGLNAMLDVCIWRQMLQ